MNQRLRSLGMFMFRPMICGMLGVSFALRHGNNAADKISQALEGPSVR